MNCPATGFSLASGTRSTQASLAGSCTVMVLVTVTGDPPLSMVRVTISGPLPWDRLSVSTPGVMVLVTASPETFHA